MCVVCLCVKVQLCVYVCWNVVHRFRKVGGEIYLCEWRGFEDL